MPLSDEECTKRLEEQSERVINTFPDNLEVSFALSVLGRVTGMLLRSTNPELRKMRLNAFIVALTLDVELGEENFEDKVMQ